MDFINGLKTFIIGILVSVTTVVAPSASPTVSTKSVLVQNSQKSTVVLPKASPLAQIIPITIPLPGKPTKINTPLPLTGENYHYIKGTYSYLGASIKYHLLVPKNGGPFSGSIEGACQAQLGGSSTGGNPALISGKAGGKCQFLFVKYQGSIDFKGILYPEDKKIVVELQNSGLAPFTLKYN